jgi:Zn-dependent protease
MFGRLRFGRIRGIPITASGSWLFVVFIMIWLLGQHFDDVTNASRTSSVLLAAATVGLFFVSVVAHELGHAIAAQRVGLRVLGIDLWLFGGFARLDEAPRTPAEELRVAAAGPAVTLALAIIFLGSVVLIDQSGLEAAIRGDNTTPFAAVLFLIGSLNVAVLVLNLLPAYPLDGGRVARALAWRVTGDPHRATQISAGIGQGIGLGLVAGGVAISAFTSAGATGVAMALLGGLMAASARSSRIGSVLQERLDRTEVGAVADASVLAVDGHHTVLAATEQGGPRSRWVVVRRDAGTPALITAAAIDEAMAKGQPTLTLSELAEELPDLAIDSHSSLRNALSDPRLRMHGALLAIAPGGEALGVVTAEAVARAVTPSGQGLGPPRPAI